MRVVAGKLNSTAAIEPRHVALMQKFINPAQRPKPSFISPTPGVKAQKNPAVKGQGTSIMPDMMGWAQSPQGQDILKRLISGDTKVVRSRPQGQNIQPG